VAALEAVVRELIASANLVHDSAAAIVDRAPIDRLIALTAVPAGTPRTLTDEEITDEDAKGTCPVHDR
jgi:hypothetical protein